MTGSCFVHLMGLDNRPISLPPPWAFSPPANPRCVRRGAHAVPGGRHLQWPPGCARIRDPADDSRAVVAYQRDKPLLVPPVDSPATAREWVDDLAPLYHPTASRWLAVTDRTTPSPKARYVVPDSGRGRPGVIRRQQTRSLSRREGRRTTGLLVDVLMTTRWPSTTIRREAKVTEVDCPHHRSTCQVALLDRQRPMAVRHFRYGDTDRPGSRAGRGTSRVPRQPRAVRRSQWRTARRVRPTKPAESPATPGP